MLRSAAEEQARLRHIAAHRWMLLARTMEEKMSSLYRAGRIVGGVYLGRGQEAFSAALGMALRKGDVFGPLIRDLAGRLAFGEPLLDTPRTYLGSAAGPMRGRDGNIHRGRPKEGMPAMISHLGSLVSVVGGMLFARRLLGATGMVGATVIGDGGTSTGAFHEAMNLAAVEHLPIVVAVADNQFAYSTPTARQFACRDLLDRAQGYGMTGHGVDGTDVAQCLDVFQTAVDKARAGEGPQMVVGRMLRLSGHGEHDDAAYVPEALRKSPLGRDCLEVSAEYLRQREWGTVEEISAMRGAALSEVEKAIAQAQQESGPDALRETWRPLASTHLMEGSLE